MGAQVIFCLLAESSSAQQHYPTLQLLSQRHLPVAGMNSAEIWPDVANQHKHLSCWACSELLQRGTSAQAESASALQLAPLPSDIKGRAQSNRLSIAHHRIGIQDSTASQQSRMTAPDIASATPGLAAIFQIYKAAHEALLHLQ